VDTLKLIEKQSGFFRLIYYLHEKGETQITTIIEDTEIPVHQLYSSIEKGRNLNLINTRVDTSSYPNKNMISLTEKGEKIGKKLLEMVELIKSD
jgi:DNA-binding PadR family transcriptional regulator